MESCFLDGKTPNSVKKVLINFLAHSLHIVILLKTRGKDAFFSKSHINAVIRVF